MNEIVVQQIYREVTRKQWPRLLRNAVRRVTQSFSERAFDRLTLFMLRGGLILPLFGTTFANDELNLLNSIGDRVGGAVGGYLTTLALDVALCGTEPA